VADDRRARVERLSEQRRALLERLRATGGRLSDGTLARGRSPLVPLRAGGPGPPLFLVHAISGSAYSYLGLARLLGSNAAVVGLEAPGLAGEQRPIESLTELAARYVRAVRARQPDGPYRLAGWSMGAMVAFEMAQQLVGAGQETSPLVLIDPDAPGPYPAPDEVEVIRVFVANLAGVLGTEAPPLDRVLDGVRDAEVPLELLHEVLTAAGMLEGGDLPFLEVRYLVFRANLRALLGYRPAEGYPGRLTLVRASESPDHRLAWSRLARQVEEVVVPGDHYTMWSDANLPALTAVLDGRLAR
jgi:thioesterase domain-containing protein